MYCLFLKKMNRGSAFFKVVSLIIYIRRTLKVTLMHCVIIQSKLELIKSSINTQKQKKQSLSFTHTTRKLLVATLDA